MKYKLIKALFLGFFLGMGLFCFPSPKVNTPFIFNTEIEDKEYLIKAEFNTSFDYNDNYTKKTSGVNGQPSVIYSARIPADFNNESDEIKLSFDGCFSLVRIN